MKEIDDYFITTLDAIDRRLKSIEKLSKTTRLAHEQQCFNVCNEHALKLQDASEKLTLLSRKLPIYTWQPTARELVSACIKQNFKVEIGFTDEGWFCVKMPFLLPKKNGGSVDYIRQNLYLALTEFFTNKKQPRMENVVLIYRHIYDKNRPNRKKRDHDNIEINMVSDTVALFTMADDEAMECRHFYMSEEGEKEQTEVYVVPQDEFKKWLDMIENSEIKEVVLNDN